MDEEGADNPGKTKKSKDAKRKASLLLARCTMAQAAFQSKGTAYTDERDTCKQGLRKICF